MKFGTVQKRILLALLKLGRSDLKGLVEALYPEPPDLGPYQTPNLKGTVSESVRRLRARGLVKTELDGRILEATLTPEGKTIAMNLECQINERRWAELV